jgi:pantothenate kinase
MQIEELAGRAHALAETGTRRILGIVGAPGAGKSTLAALIAAQLDGAAALVPMDGLHLADAELSRLGRLGRKGAPDTFDAYGYAALLRRLRAAEPGETVYAPAFERTLEQPLAGSIPVHPSMPLVITEGNYLLLPDPPWNQIKPLLDETWYIEIDDAVRLERLIRRHIAFGKTPDDAARWAHGTDEANARLIAASRDRADLIVPAEAFGGRAAR